MWRHIRYWLARLRNDFLRLCWFGPSEEQYVEEIMSSLKRDAHLEMLLNEHESKLEQRSQRENLDDVE